MSRLSALIRRWSSAAAVARRVCPRGASDVSWPGDGEGLFPFFRWSFAAPDGRLLPDLPFPPRLIRVDELALVVDALDRVFHGDRRAVPMGRFDVWLADEPPPDDGGPWLAYGRQIGRADTVLMPDGYFMRSGGYAALRHLAASGGLPAWSEREETLFWRGAPTGRADDLSSIPRVRLVERCAGMPGMDVAFSATAGRTADEVMHLQRLLASRDAFRPAVPMAGWARFRHLVDIDGYGNAWGFFEKLLLGSCVLKVESAVEQWFYRHLEAGIHYLPVRADLSDLPERLGWCRENPDRAAAIGRAGQAFALMHASAAAIAETAQALAEALTRFPERPPPAVRPAAWLRLRYRGYLWLLRRGIAAETLRQRRSAERSGQAAG